MDCEKIYDEIKKMDQRFTNKLISFFSNHKVYICLSLILFTAIILRYSGLNWDNLYTIHPDERSIGFAGMEINLLAGKLDPNFFAYGSLPIYLAELLSNFLSLFKPLWNSFNYYILAGRIIAATAGIISIIMTFLIGKKLYNSTIGLLSALFLTFTVLHIQYSHFATVDILLTSFILSILYLLIDIYKAQATIKTYIAVAILLGLALAVKVSAAPLVFIFLLCHIIRSYKEKELFTLKPWILFTICGIIALIVNFISQPYAYIRLDAFLERVFSELELAKHCTTCYTQQYIGSAYIFYYLKEIIFTAMGPPLGILCIIGFALSIIQSLFRPFKSPHLVLLFWAIPYFLTINSFEAKFLRYLQPLLPLLCLFGAYYFYHLIQYLKQFKTGKSIAMILRIVLIGYTAFYALAFFSIYMRPHTFVEGSKWFYKNIPEHSTVLSQHWDEGFPLHLGSEKALKYNKVDLELYEHFGAKTEDLNKVKYLSTHLEKADYIVAQTRRLYGAVATVEERYPVTKRYFDLLFTDRLGFELVKDFTSYPSLLGIEFNDDLADESFSVYDHPKILIFKKVRNLSKEDYNKLLNPSYDSSLSKKELLTLRHQDHHEFYRFSIVDEILLVLGWIGLFEIFSLIGLIIAYLFLRKHLKSSIFLSYIIGILVYCYLIWILTATHLIIYNALTLLLILGTILFICFTYINHNKNELMKAFREHISTLILSKCLFIGIFLVFIFIRSTAPEIYWGEKPMDYGIFNHLIRITSLPPEEIWFAGKHLEYYYFGQFIFATLTKLSHIPAFFSYNYAIASLGGLIASSITAILILLTRNILFSLSIGTLSVFWANLSGLRETLYGKYPIGFDYYWATSRVIPHTINEYPLWGILFGDLHAHLCEAPLFLTSVYFILFICLQLLTIPKIPWNVVSLLCLSIGAIGVTNSWNIPTIFSLLFTGLLVMTIHQKSVSIGIKSVAIVIITMLASFGLFLPYWVTNQSPVNVGFGRIMFFEAFTINDFLTHWGFFIFGITAFYLYEIGKYVYESSSKNVNNRNCFIIITICLIGIIITLIHSAFSFTAFLLLLGFLSFLHKRSTLIWLIKGFTVIALAQLVFTQVFYISDHMNTVFKFFLSSWYILYISVFMSLFYLSSKLKDCQSGRMKIIKYSIIGITSILTLLTLFTAITASIGYTLTDRVKLQYLTTNGIAYLKPHFTYDYLAIKWINKNIEGIPTILEAQGHGYGEYSRITMNTGLPTLAGWEHHLSQRGVSKAAYSRRAEDIKTIYETTNPDHAHFLLKKYGVKYIYEGSLEHKTYKKAGFKKFNSNPHLFKQIYKNEKVRIYQVL